MAMEQMRAFRQGRLQTELGSAERLEPDGFPILNSSELRPHHEEVSQLLSIQGQNHSSQFLMKDPVLLRMLDADREKRTGYYLALLERTFACDAHLSTPTGFDCSSFFDYGLAALALAALFDKGVETNAVVSHTLDWFACYRFNCYSTPVLERLISAVEIEYQGKDIPEKLRQQLITVRGQLADGKDIESVLANVGHWLHNAKGADGRPLQGELLPQRLDTLLGEGPWLTLVPCEIWTCEALHKLAALPKAERDTWLSLLKHCHAATAARPSAKWLKNGQILIDRVGHDEFVQSVLDWFPKVDAGRHLPMITVSWENADDQQRMHETNASVLKGLLWLCPYAEQPELIRSVGRLASSAYRKAKGLGPRAVKVGNAAVYALSVMEGEEAVGQLAILKVRIKFGSAQKEIEKAFNAAAERFGLPRDEVEEMSIPAYGLTEVGRCFEKFGDFTAELTVTGPDSTSIAWIKSDGKRQQSVAAGMKERFADDLKDLQAAAKDIQRMLPAQCERIDNLFREQKTWPFVIWRERYLEHPLVGVLARRLIWEFTNGKQTTAGIYFNSVLVDLDLKPLKKLGDGTTVQLWHPIGRNADEIVAWRAWLDAQQVQQPFKQAHREVYLLTDAERRTRTYSNRFAAHIIRQHQFNALCATRSWKNKLRLMVDQEFPPATVALPKWNLRAEFWIEGVGEDYGTDTNESGVYLRVATDQVRFYQIAAPQVTGGGFSGPYSPRHGEEAAEPIPLEEIPPLLFSEVMRDVDLFVGVASVGNDPTWNDGGPEGRYREYWQNYSFGDLNASAKTRKDVLQRLVPKLRIENQCSFEEKFLVVKGSLRTYKIHLGSGNILMKPNDQYLCIVPKQGAAEDGKVLLPFEGDRTLSVIISKAFLLAADAKIKDPTIVNQIKS